MLAHTKNSHRYLIHAAAAKSEACDLFKEGTGRHYQYIPGVAGCYAGHIWMTFSYEVLRVSPRQSYYCRCLIE